MGGLVGGVLGRDWWLTQQVQKREELLLAEFPVVAELAATDVRLAYAPAGAACATARGYLPTMTRGEEFSVCVTVTPRIPLLPDFIDASTATGHFVVQCARYVDG